MRSVKKKKQESEIENEGNEDGVDVAAEIVQELGKQPPATPSLPRGRSSSPLTTAPTVRFKNIGKDEDGDDDDDDRPGSPTEELVARRKHQGYREPPSPVAKLRRSARLQSRPQNSEGVDTVPNGAREPREKPKSTKTVRRINNNVAGKETNKTPTRKPRGAPKKNPTDAPTDLEDPEGLSVKTKRKGRKSTAKGGASKHVDTSSSVISDVDVSASDSDDESDGDSVSRQHAQSGRSRRKSAIDSKRTHEEDGSAERGRVGLSSIMKGESGTRTTTRSKEKGGAISSTRDDFGVMAEAEKTKAGGTRKTRRRKEDAELARIDEEGGSDSNETRGENVGSNSKAGRSRVANKQRGGAVKSMADKAREVDERSRSTARNQHFVNKGSKSAARSRRADSEEEEEAVKPTADRAHSVKELSRSTAKSRRNASEVVTGKSAANRPRAANEGSKSASRSQRFPNGHEEETVNSRPNGARVTNNKPTKQRVLRGTDEEEGAVRSTENGGRVAVPMQRGPASDPRGAPQQRRGGGSIDDPNFVKERALHQQKSAKRPTQAAPSLGRMVQGGPRRHLAAKDMNRERQANARLPIDVPQQKRKPGNNSVPKRNPGGAELSSPLVRPLQTQRKKAAGQNIPSISVSTCLTTKRKAKEAGVGEPNARANKKKKSDHFAEPVIENRRPRGTTDQISAGVLTTHRKGRAFKLPDLSALSRHRMAMEGQQADAGGGRERRVVDTTAPQRNKRSAEEDAEAMPAMKRRRSRGQGSAQEDQKTFYTGDARLMVEYACTYFRIELATKDLFPTTRGMLRLVSMSYKRGATKVYKKGTEGTQPKITWGIDKILRDQAWEFRGRIKQLVKGKINNFYKIQLNPTSKKLKAAKSEAERQRIIAKDTVRRIEDLLIDGAFLCQPVGEEEEEIPYSHPALLETIVLLFFPKKSRAMSLTALDLDAFDPIPLPVMALAATVLHNCLEEYATGEYVEVPYSEQEYRSFYHVILDNLMEFSLSRSRGHLLEKIQRDIFRAGVMRMGAMRARVIRTRGPFIPSSPIKLPSRKDPESEDDNIEEEEDVVEDNDSDGDGGGGGDEGDDDEESPHREQPVRAKPRRGPRRRQPSLSEEEGEDFGFVFNSAGEDDESEDDEASQELEEYHGRGIGLSRGRDRNRTLKHPLESNDDHDADEHGCNQDEDVDNRGVESGVDGYADNGSLSADDGERARSNGDEDDQWVSGKEDEEGGDSDGNMSGGGGYRKRRRVLRYSSVNSDDAAFQAANGDESEYIDVELMSELDSQGSYEGSGDYGQEGVERDNLEMNSQNENDEESSEVSEDEDEDVSAEEDGMGDEREYGNDYVEAMFE